MLSHIILDYVKYKGLSKTCELLVTLKRVFLFFTGQNVDSMIFKEVMHELARKLGHLGKDFSDT